MARSLFEMHPWSSDSERKTTKSQKRQEKKADGQLMSADSVESHGESYKASKQLQMQAAE